MMRPAIFSSFLSALLFLTSAPGIAACCPSAKRCEANCAITNNIAWREGTPGYEADMRICVDRCMSGAGKNPACATQQPESEQSARPADGNGIQFDNLRFRPERSGPEDRGG